LTAIPSSHGNFQLPQPRRDTRPQVLDARVDYVAKKGRALYHDFLPATTRRADTPSRPGKPMLRTLQVKPKTLEEQDKLRRSGRLAADVLDMIGVHVKPGVSTDQLDALCNDFIVHSQRTVPANVGYRGFPKTVCTSVNHVVCHGIPNEKVLKSGDIINIDVAIIHEGFHGDTSRMYYVGEPPVIARRLTDICREAMLKGIGAVRPGACLGDVGHAIQTHTEAAGFTVVREYCGHGIGRIYHEEPQVLHYGEPNTGIELKAGMVFTVEPMINAGKRHTRVLPDGWTVITKDHSLSAQWEHMVLVTTTGHEILTLSAAERAGDLAVVA
jgi:methionyl aminopeptidase